MPEIQRVVGFSLAGEIGLGFVAREKPINNFLSDITRIMQLREIANPTIEIALTNEGLNSINSETEPHVDLSRDQRYIFSKNPFWAIYPKADKDAIIYSMSRQLIESDFYFQLYCMSILIGIIALDRGGMLIHGALADRNDEGIILVGRSGVGKTTASKRFPAPWQSLSDDLTVVVPDSHGTYWAHPLPSHSRFLNGPGGTWDVQHALPLRGLFFLSQNDEDQVHPLELADTLRLLIESSRQTLLLFSKSKAIGQEMQMSINKQLFNNSLSLCHAVPGYSLGVSLTGKFWLKIEQVLNGERK